MQGPFVTARVWQEQIVLSLHTVLSSQPVSLLQKRADQHAHAQPVKMKLQEGKRVGQT